MLRIILRIIAPNSAQKYTKSATKTFKHGFALPPPPGLNNVKKKQTIWYGRASLSQRIGFRCEESIADQPNHCVGLFSPLATLLILSNQPTQKVSFSSSSVCIRQFDVPIEAEHSYLIMLYFTDGQAC